MRRSSRLPWTGSVRRSLDALAPPVAAARAILVPTRTSELWRQILSPNRRSGSRPPGAVLSVDAMSSDVGANRFLDGGKETLFAEVCQEAEALQLVLHRILHLGKTHLDARGVQRLVEFAHRIGG